MAATMTEPASAAGQMSDLCSNLAITTITYPFRGAVTSDAANSTRHSSKTNKLVFSDLNQDGM